jgi:hypothetical protein
MTFASDHPGPVRRQPSSSIIFGNMLPEEDSLSTFEKIRITALQVGTYRIYVKANPSFVPESVSFALAVNGQFAHLDLAANPVDLQAKRGITYPESCDRLHPATFCGTDVTELGHDKKQQFRIRPREHSVFHDVRDFGIETGYSKLSECYATPENLGSMVVQSISHPCVQRSLGSVESWMQVRGW